MSSITEVETKAEPKLDMAVKPEIVVKEECQPAETVAPKAESPKSPKPKLPKIKTPPSSATLPSTLPSALPKSPATGRLEAIRREEEDLRTPITPPSAYTEFLKALSPAMSTPSTGRSPIFDRLYSGKTTPITQPNSATSCCCTNATHEPPLKTATSAPIIPPSPFMGPPRSARTPTALRRLRIPQSPMWSPVSDSPHSSCNSMRSPFSSANWDAEKMRRIYESPRSATQKPVSVRQVVTRTVTYTRSPITPLDPAPKGKKRRVE